MTVAPAPVTPARRVTLAGPAAVVAAVSPEMLRLALLGKVVTEGDNVSLLPQDVLPDAAVRGLVEAARRSLANTVGYAWTSTLLTVVAAEPETGALVTMDTVVGWEHGQVTHGSADPARPDRAWTTRADGASPAGPPAPPPARRPAPMVRPAAAGAREPAPRRRATSYPGCAPRPRS